MDLDSDEKIRVLRPLIEALFKHVLYDDEPIFVSDSATMLDVSMSSPEELQKRCAQYYRKMVPSTIFDARCMNCCQCWNEVASMASSEYCPG